MDRRSPAYEATLLSEDADLPDIRDLQQALRIALQQLGETRCSFERVDPHHHLIKARETQILIALSTEPLPVEGFRQAGKSSAACDALRRLTQTVATITVIALPRSDVAYKADHGASMAQLEALGCAVLETLMDAHPVCLIFDGNAGTLCATEDYQRRALTLPGEWLIEPPKRSRFLEQPRLSPEQLAWLESGEPRSKREPRRGFFRSWAASAFMS